MTTTKQDALKLMCHCGAAPGQPCWENGNVHPNRHVTHPGPRIQVFDGDGFKMLYDSNVSDKTPDEFLAMVAASGVPVKVRVKGRGLSQADVIMNEVKERQNGTD